MTGSSTDSATAGGPLPSRALNVSARQAAVRVSAAKHAAPISAIETILSGGTRVVFMNIADAERMRHVFRNRMLTGAVVRTRRLPHG